MTRNPEWLTLEGDESVVWTGRPRTMSLAGTVLGAAVRTAVVLAAVWAVTGGHVDGLLPSAVPSVRAMVPGTALLAVAGLAVVWAVAEVGWGYLVIANVDYVLTDRNLYKKTGVGSETVTRVGLDRIQSTSLSKDLTGNLFDYGSVAVSTAGGSGVEMVITDLDAPDELRNELRRLVNEAGSGRTAGSGAVGAGGGPSGTGSGTLREVVREARTLRERTAAVEEVLEG